MVNAEIVKVSKVKHELIIRKGDKEYNLSIKGFSVFQLKDYNNNIWLSNSIDFTDSLRFSVNIFDRLLNIFCCDFEILHDLMEEGHILEEYINTALEDIDMSNNKFKIKHVPISKENIKLRTYLNYSTINKVSACLMCDPNFKSLVCKKYKTKKIDYIKQIARKEKVIPIIEKVLGKIDINFDYPLKPMTAESVLYYLEGYLKSGR